MRAVSDRLCKEYGLSVVEKPRSTRTKPYPELHPEQKKLPTIHALLYEDMDRALETAANLDSFYDNLRAMGYRVRRSGKYPAIAPPGKNFFRLYKFASGYREEDIQRRLDERLQVRTPRRSGSSPPKHGQAETANHWQTYSPAFIRLRPWVRHRRFRSYLLRRRRWQGLARVYVQFCYILKSIDRKSYPRWPSMDLRRESYKLQWYGQQALLLCKYNINDAAQLHGHMVLLEQPIKSINQERIRVRRKLKKDLPPEERTRLKDRLRELTAQVKELYRERALCKDILERSGAVGQIVEQERAEAVCQEEIDKGKEKEKDEPDK